MVNLVLIVVESIRRLGGLRRLAGGFPPVVQLVAALSTVVLVAFSAITFVGGTIFGDGDGTPTPTVPATVTASPPPVEGTATPLPTGSLRVLEVSWCLWGPPFNGDSVALLYLGLEIAGNRDFSRQVPFKALEDNREWSGSFGVEEEYWEAGDRFVVESVDFELELEAEDLGKRHDIIVRVDPNDATEAFERSNIETSVRVDIPATPPSEDQELPCTSPVP
jgi:hypothetical protein